jgi:hypothetical protein
MTVISELERYRLYLVGVQEVRWDKGGTVRAGDYTFLYGKSVLMTKYYSGGQIEKNEVGGACSTYGRGERCI